MRAKIAVLLSTYNGEKYLREQINSLIAQRDVIVKILVRDDGSTDSTKAMLEKWQKEGILTWYEGENLKPAKSFMDLVEKAPDADYYAFCDQDDYWMPDKLSTAVSMLQNNESSPALYFCQTQLVDSDLKKIDNVIIHPLLSFGESLVYHFIGGCTMVFNKMLRNIVLQYKPSYLSMHDVWVYKIALAIGGRICFDPTPHILYRQHGGNVVGQGNVSVLRLFKSRLKRTFFEKDCTRYKFALELRKGFYEMMPPENQLIIDDFIIGKRSFKKRLTLLMDNRFLCSSKSVYRNFKLSLLFNSY